MNESMKSVEELEKDPVNLIATVIDIKKLESGSCAVNCQYKFKDKKLSRYTMFSCFISKETIIEESIMVGSKIIFNDYDFVEKSVVNKSTGSLMSFLNLKYEAVALCNTETNIKLLMEAEKKLNTKVNETLDELESLFSR